MKIKSFQVQRYRNISDTGQLKLGDYTVIAGPNNQGKSNLIRALAIAMAELSDSNHKHKRRSVNSRLSRSREVDDRTYVWTRDYPKRSEKKGETQVSIHFSLNSEDECDFKKITGNRITNYIIAEVSFDRVKTSILFKKQRATNILQQKQPLLLEFVQRRIGFLAIDAFRDAVAAGDQLGHIIDIPLSSARNDEQYQTALNEYESARNSLLAIEHRILNDEFTQLKPRLQSFLPDIKQIKLSAPAPPRMLRGTNAGRYSRMGSGAELSQDILVDDGEETTLSAKGAGIQSLFTLGLLLGAKPTENTTMVFAVEEPEAHLHPGAVRKLRPAFMELSTRAQVIVTTHSPVLATSAPSSSSIIVDSGRIENETDPAAIRETLGVSPEDNGACALKVVVEGYTDVRIFSCILSRISPRIRQALKSEQVIVVPAGRASKVPTQAAAILDKVTQCIAILDDDQAGNQYAEEASSHLGPDNVFVLSMLGQECSEIEDFILSEFTNLAIRKVVGDAKFSEKALRKQRGNWKQKLTSMLKVSGQANCDQVIKQVKSEIPNVLDSIGKHTDVINPNGLDLLNSIAKRIEDSLP